MNEGKQTDVLKRMFSCPCELIIYALPMACVKRIANGSNSIPCVSMMCPVHYQIWKRGTYVRTCVRTPFVACMKCMASWPTIAHQISSQWFQPFPRYEKNVCECASANIGTPSVICVTPMAGGALYPHTKSQSNASSRFRDTEDSCGRADVPHS